MEGRGTRRTDVHRVVRLRSSVAVSDHGMNLEDAVSRGNGMHANRPMTSFVNLDSDEQKKTPFLTCHCSE